MSDLEGHYRESEPSGLTYTWLIELTNKQKKTVKIQICFKDKQSTKG